MCNLAIELSFSFGTTNPAQIWEGQADLEKLTKKADWLYLSYPYGQSDSQIYRTHLAHN